MITDKFDDLMYQSGLTAQGSYDTMDKYDQEAIIKFAKLIVRETINVMGQQMSDLGDDQSNNPTWYKAQIKTLEYFGVKE
jgi:hypothetical protein